MPFANTIWQIAFGDYDFAIDRKSLTYRLAETKTGTLWADSLSVGWLELLHSGNGERTRHDFGAMRLVSLSEKSGPQGKRILFGLDCQGVPADITFTCSQREIQLTVEASRDTRDYQVSEVCLLPGLVSVPDDGVSYLVVPSGTGTILRAKNVSPAERRHRVWSFVLNMPFIGAVRSDARTTAASSALACITDSAYATMVRRRTANHDAQLDWHFERDPERRRLDIRIVPIPGGDSVSVARAYRDKIVGERNHVTLRRKARERPKVEALLGGTLVVFANFVPDRDNQTYSEVARIARDLRDYAGVERGALVLANPYDPDGNTERRNLLEAAGGETGFRGAADIIRNMGFSLGLFRAGWRQSMDVAISEAQLQIAPDLWHDLGATLGLVERPAQGIPTLWDDMDRRLERILSSQEQGAAFGSDSPNDWSALACDYWWCAPNNGPHSAPMSATATVPLYAVVYHDSVIRFPRPLSPRSHHHFLRAVLNLSPPAYVVTPGKYFDAAASTRDYIRRTDAVLGPMHGLCFSAFLTEHRFLTPDFLVEEARYSNGAYVLINQSRTADYQNERFTLPPGGFYAEHAQMVAHDALRVGSEVFDTRAFRIARSRDGKPITESADVLRQEFPV